MKATELMYGDLVLAPYKSTALDGTFRYYPAKVLDIMRGLHTVHSCGSYAGCSDFWDDEFKPIPLTAEILKANGFISLNYDSCFVYRTSFEEDFEITKDNKGFHLRPVSIAKTNYVHELQHALRLCNLNDLADNFKLPQL